MDLKKFEKEYIVKIVKDFCDLFYDGNINEIINKYKKVVFYYFDEVNIDDEEVDEIKNNLFQSFNNVQSILTKPKNSYYKDKIFNPNISYVNEENNFREIVITAYTHILDVEDTSLTFQFIFQSYENKITLKQIIIN